MLMSMSIKQRVRAKIRVAVDANGEVTIAGNQEGLRWIARRFLVLARNPDEGHIHLQNEGDVLTSDSNLCVIQCLGADKSELKLSARKAGFLSVLLRLLMLVSVISIICMLLMEVFDGY